MSHSKKKTKQINQINQIMKTTFLILGITLVSFTNVCNAETTANESRSSFQKVYFTDDNEGPFSTGEAKITKPCVNDDEEIFSPETVIVYNGKTVKEAIAEGDKIIENNTSDDLDFMVYEESMKEIIAQSDLIIENSVPNETYPLFDQRTIEDEIAALEIIIDSKETNETKPLDFKKLNSNPIMSNSLDSPRFAGMD